MRALVSLTLVPITLLLAACGTSAATATGSDSSGPTTTTASGGSGPTTTAGSGGSTAACGSGGSTVIGAAPYQLTVTITNGFSGLDEVTVIDTAARTISYEATSNWGPPVPEQQAMLTQADVDTLTAAIEQANLEHAGGPYQTKTCEDVSGYDAKLVIGGTTYDASWEDCTIACLEALGQTIAKLDDAKFPAAAGQ